MMHRRKFVVSLAGFLAVPAAIGAQEAKTWRIGYLSLSSPTLQQSKRWIAAFKEGLERLGYVPGKNAIVEQRYAAGEIGRLPCWPRSSLILRSILWLQHPRARP
jgi:hypothetical protein